MGIHPTSSAEIPPGWAKAIPGKSWILVIIVISQFNRGLEYEDDKITITLSPVSLLAHHIEREHYSLVRCE
jgi:hypothetical protein